MLLAKFGLNRAHSMGAMAKCGINGALATKVAHLNICCDEVNHPTKFRPDRTIIVKVMAFGSPEGLLASLRFEPMTLWLPHNIYYCLSLDASTPMVPAFLVWESLCEYQKGPCGSNRQNWGYTWQFDLVWHVPRALWQQNFCVTRQPIPAAIRVQEIIFTSLAVSALCGVKFEKCLNLGYFIFGVSFPYIGGPLGDHVFHVMIRALVLVRAPTKIWSSLLLILCRMGPMNGCLLDIKRDK